MGAEALLPPLLLATGTFLTPTPLLVLPPNMSWRVLAAVALLVLANVPRGLSVFLGRLRVDEVEEPGRLTLPAGLLLNFPGGLRVFSTSA